jgi:ATP-dependent exoDNAse (exonuclease V) alpha subunit
VDYLDSEALHTRRGKGGAVVEKAKGAWALCPHGTSRELDPQLHIHAVAMNFCVRADGSTGAIRSKDIYRHKMAAGAIFRAELAYLLKTELGLVVKENNWNFTLEGVSQSLCDEQSKRRKEIVELAKKEGWTSPRVLAEIAIFTRDAKKSVELKDLFGPWQSAGERHGFTKEVAESLLGRNTKRNVEPEERRNAELKKAFDLAVDATSARNAYFTERNIVQHVATSLQSKGFSADEILNYVKRELAIREHHVRVKGDGEYLHYSTPENIAAEKELLERAGKGKESDRHIVPYESVEKAVVVVEKALSKKLGAPALLTRDQFESLLHITTEKGLIKIVQGYAGTGKTEMLSAAKIAWEKSGYKVLGTSITAKAAQNLEQATGIRSFTVEGLLRRKNPHDYRTSVAYVKLFFRHLSAAIRQSRYEAASARAWRRNPFRQAVRQLARSLREDRPKKLTKFKLTSKSILVVDEAAMLPTRALLALKRECDKVGAKLVCIGDRLQLPPIEAGGPFWALAQSLGHASLTAIMRQKQDWMREALYRLIENEPRAALELYATNDALHFAKHHKAAIDALVSDYAKLSAADRSKAIAITSTREEARQINAGIQERRKAARELGSASLKLPNGERVHIGDRVQLTVNNYSLGVTNGLLATVVKIHHKRGIVGPGAITIRLDGVDAPRRLFPGRDRTITLDLKTYGDVQLGYASTTHRVQGLTFKQCFVLLGDSMLDREMAFTQMSRASHECKLYAAAAFLGDSLVELAKRIAKSNRKDLAHEHTVDQFIQPDLSIHHVR